ncbi:hypothetical protein CDAR_288221 [Caerostris darwini]|uniref:Uncharacterized protein n=1 Tax=Caerostris darwini TaxID=1538125 RepID=A0AAV4WBN2_9ARAC|nr:hypothetical protein CDAR_288221 [Caerostris darwini]
MRTSTGGSTTKSSKSGSPMRTSPGGSTTKASTSGTVAKPSTSASQPPGDDIEVLAVLDDNPRNRRPAPRRRNTGYRPGTQSEPPPFLANFPGFRMLSFGDVNAQAEADALVKGQRGRMAKRIVIIVWLLALYVAFMCTVIEIYLHRKDSNSTSATNVTNSTSYNETYALFDL